MSCASCFVFDAGNTGSWPLSTVLLDQADPTKPVVWDTRPSRDMSSTVSVSVVVDARDLFPRVPPMVSPEARGVNQLKFQRSLRSTAEERVGRACGALRVLNSYWVCQDATYKYFEIIMIDPMHKAIRRDPRINWLCNAVHKHRELRGLTGAGKKNRGLGKGHGYSKVQGSSRRQNWKKHNTLSLKRYR